MVCKALEVCVESSGGEGGEGEGQELGVDYRDLMYMSSTFPDVFSIHFEHRGVIPLLGE